MASVGSALGVGSGLELSTLLTNLMAAEKVPLTKLQAQATSAQTKISALGQLKSSLSSLLTAAAGLTPEKFTGLVGSSSDSSVAFITADNKAGKISHKLDVTSLAQAEKAVSGALASDAQLNTGTLTFTLGKVENGSFVAGEAEAKSVVIDASNNTMSGLRDAINKAEMGVTASLVTDGTGSRLVLTSTTTGAANAFQVTSADSGTGGTRSLDFFDYDPATAPSYSSGGSPTGMSRLQAGADAQFKLDGMEVTSATNTVTSVLDGVTITLQKSGTTTIATNPSPSGGAAALQSLVTAYNAFLNVASALSANAPSDTRGKAGATGPLAGDGLVRDLTARMRNEVFSPMQGATGPYTTLASLGVGFDQDGALTLDTDKFNKAMAADPGAVSRLFTPQPFGEGSQSLVERFTAQLSPYTDSKGVIDSRTDGLKSTIKTLETQQTQMSNRLEEIEARYRRQFTALDSMLTQLNNTGSFLTQQIEALKNLNK
ncbi:flagellar filament capping protein FliD [Pigmentiphaga kullae]|uniref:Flagellar hook-associated protein 2 n=1 Tax=Pigmentiphaga kullae TaxID=151784 RepID=A0A4Q7N9F9_9BURK|nr:flagellar filament capping protein FliD [Pigmentiphaga kullae]RZS78709.1 flagellar hook-associated protein 2 [Pigmentiphaga kullae]